MKEEFVFDSLQDCETIRQFFASLEDGFASGRVSFNSHGEEIQLNPQGLLNFSVKAKRKEGESKISIKVTWKETKKVSELVNSTLNVTT